MNYACFNHTFVFTFFSLIVFVSSGKPRWDIGNLNGFHYMHCTEQPLHVTTQESLVIWWGEPASGPRVTGKLGEMALPSAWGPFVDVLYIRPELTTSMSCNETTNSQFVDFMIAKQYFYPTVFFAGVWDAGASCIPSIVKYFSTHVSNIQYGGSARIGGVSIIDGPQTPSALFFTHGSLETGNGETQYSINRASQDVVCNARLSSIQLVLNDVRFEYVPIEKEQVQSRHAKTVEYKLKQVDVPGVGCYTAKDYIQLSKMENKTQSWEHLPFIGQTSSFKERTCDINDHILATSIKEDIRPLDDDDDKQSLFISKELSDLYELLRNPIGRVSLVSTLQSHHKITCSFYIGIFEAEALEMIHQQSSFPNNINNVNKKYHNESKTFSKFNQEELEVLWPMGDHEPIGEFQETLSQLLDDRTSLDVQSNDKLLADRRSESEGLLIWTHVSVKSTWTRRAALRFLSLMKGDVSELDYFSSE